ncbi:MAG: hypothetical protein COA78_11660 [Blastopirellula sp.]|nr:MAG: hypothetical protein COA78_11660 [Blastopirellula sp.]
MVRDLIIVFFGLISGKLMKSLITIHLIFVIVVLSYASLAVETKADDGSSPDDTKAQQTKVVEKKITTFAQLMKQAESGDVEAQVKLGWHYDQKRELDKALSWYKKAANQGYAVGQFNVAEMLRDGAGVKQDKAKALEYYLKAAKQGYPKAQYCIGIMYATGEGTKEDLNKSYIWLALSAYAKADGGTQARDLIARNMDKKSLESAKATVSKIIAKLEARRKNNVNKEPGGDG